jgi:hypothetical protein
LNLRLEQCRRFDRHYHRRQFLQLVQLMNDHLNRRHRVLLMNL